MRRLGFIGFALCLAAGPLAAQSINYGDDSSEWANDGQCDDRRFVGASMAEILNNEDIGRDATDCKSAVGAGHIKAWSALAASKATQCEAFDFGDNTSEFADDNECDDMRFEGLGMASNVGPDSIGHDANDCSRFCDAGVIAVRNY